jgi:hypothetical protein
MKTTVAMMPIIRKVVQPTESEMLTAIGHLGHEISCFIGSSGFSPDHIATVENHDDGH